MRSHVSTECSIAKLQRDEFDILNLKKFNTPAAPGTVLKKPDKGKEILAPAKQTQYRSGVGKGLHMMQYSQPDTYNI